MISIEGIITDSVRRCRDDFFRHTDILPVKAGSI